MAYWFQHTLWICTTAHHYFRTAKGALGWYGDTMCVRGRIFP